MIELSNWKWCYQKEDGTFSKGWEKIDESWYFFNDKGVMLTGWQKVENKWYYLEETKGDSEGKMYIDCEVTIGDTAYTFTKNGSLSTNLVSDRLVDFVKKWEGFSSQKYDDGCGVLTQGYGCTGEEIKDWCDIITEEVASNALIDLLNNKYAPILKADLMSRNVQLSQTKFDALVSLAYNIGTSGVLGSTLYDLVLKGESDIGIIENAFIMWSKGMIKGKLTRIEGLYKRRLAESEMFNFGNYSN